MPPDDYLDFELTLSKAGDLYRAQLVSAAGRGAASFPDPAAKNARDAIDAAIRFGQAQA